MNSNLALTLGYLNPALNNSAQMKTKNILRRLVRITCRAVVFQLSLKNLHVKITNLLRVVV